MRALLARPLFLLGDALHRLAVRVQGPAHRHVFVWPWQLRRARTLVDAVLPLDGPPIGGPPGSLIRVARRLRAENPHVNADAIWQAFEERVSERRARRTPDTVPAGGSR